MPAIIFTVTNDLSYDQRMHRIAGSLADNGYQVLLVGRKMRRSVPLPQRRFVQRRLHCLFEKGFLFYAAYNLRLFFFLLSAKADIVCAIDLDTILPVYFSTLLKKQQRVYDAHELFTEQKEIVTRSFVHRCWLAIERFAVPRFAHGYTVNGFIAGELEKRYRVRYQVIRNFPRLNQLPEINSREKWIIYQGAVNEGRCFETLIPAMQYVPARLVIFGGGNFYRQAKALVKQYRLENKVEFRGYTPPEQLAQQTPQAYFGLTLFEATGLNQYQSLSNRFFDYMMAGIPQVCVDYPEYAVINAKHAIALPVADTTVTSLAAAMNNLLANDVLYAQLRLNCLATRLILNWENEALVLLAFYNSL